MTVTNKTLFLKTLGEPIKSGECLFVFHLGPKQDGWTVELIKLFSRGFTEETRGSVPGRAMWDLWKTKWH